MPEQTQSHYLDLKSKIDETILNSRRIFLSDAVDSDTAADIIRKLWYLELQNPGKPILFVINSPGGSVDAGFAILGSDQTDHFARHHGSLRAGGLDGLCFKPRSG